MGEYTAENTPYGKESALAFFVSFLDLYPECISRLKYVLVNCPKAEIFWSNKKIWDILRKSKQAQSWLFTAHLIFSSQTHSKEPKFS